MNDFEVIGLGVIGFGVLFFLIGLFGFNRNFLVTSNLLMIIGTMLFMKIKTFFNFLIQKIKLKGTLSFFIGFTLVLFKLPLPGILCEIVGIYWLFGGFLPALLSLISKIPIISYFFPSFLKNKNDQYM